MHEKDRRVHAEDGRAHVRRATSQQIASMRRSGTLQRRTNGLRAWTSTMQRSNPFDQRCTRVVQRSIFLMERPKFFVRRSRVRPACMQPIRARTHGAHGRADASAASTDGNGSRKVAAASRGELARGRAQPRGSSPDEHVGCIHGSRHALNGRDEPCPPAFRTDAGRGPVRDGARASPRSRRSRSPVRARDRWRTEARVRTGSRSGAASRGS